MTNTQNAVAMVGRCIPLAPFTIGGVESHFTTTLLVEPPENGYLTGLYLPPMPALLTRFEVGYHMLICPWGADRGVLLVHGLAWSVEPRPQFVAGVGAKLTLTEHEPLRELITIQGASVWFVPNAA